MAGALGMGYARPVTDRREAPTETRLTRAVRTLGALTYKLSPTTAGIPDRVVIWPGGTVDFVEVKRERGGSVSPIQAHRIAELRGLGANVFVVAGDAEVDEYVLARREALGLRPSLRR